MTRPFRQLDDEIAAWATTWLGNWPRPDLTVFVPTEDDDDPDEE